ncbi:MAG: PaaI family thioesterase [Pseudomonadota bacterium]
MASEQSGLATLASMSGLQIMEAVRDGTLPRAPIGEIANMHGMEVSFGRVVFEGTPERRHYNPMGAVHGGWFGIMLDSAMGCAVMSALPAGQVYTTLEYKVNILRAATADTGVLRAIGQTIHVGRRTATAEARLENADGKLFATGTTTCLIMSA